MVYPHTYRAEHSETRTSNSVYGDYYAQHQSKKIPIQPELLKILQFIDSHRDVFLKDLSDAVEIKSISGDLKYREQMKKMIQFTEDWLVKLGLKYETFDIGFHELGEHKVKLPTIILASLGTDVRKKTICVYANLDVKKTDENLWHTDPWKVTVLNHHKICGCGVAQGKATLMHWFHVIQAFQQARIQFPVNLKFIFEGMYHQNSIGLLDFLPLRKHDFFYDIDNIILCDSEWIGEKYPCIIYGTVGFLHFDLIVEKVPDSKTDPRDDLMNISKELVDQEERILIPHFDDIVTQVTPEEEKMYEKICDFNMEDIRSSLPPFKQNWDKVKLLMNCWRFPSAWIDETEECTCDKKNSDIVKRHMITKLVPRQITDRCASLTINYVNHLVKKLNIQNKVTCELTTSTRYWHENVRSPNYQAARRATIQIYKEDPNMIREDRARLLPTILDRVLEKNVLLLPLVSRGSNAGSVDENVTVRNFFESTKLLAAYLFQIVK